jgi:hypothetical protein
MRERLTKIAGRRNQNPAPEVAPEACHTTRPVHAGDFTGIVPEFGRVADLSQHFGIKRGTAYNLLADGKIRGCLLRVRGAKSGVRLFDMGSVRDFINSQMQHSQAA